MRGQRLVSFLPDGSVGDSGVLCLGHAGSGASEFWAWAVNPDVKVQVLALRLAGRESRCDESPPLSAEEAVEDVLDVIVGLRQNVALGLYGQCSGSAVMLQLARKLCSLGHSPAFLCVGSPVGPSTQFREENHPLLHLPMSGQLEVLRQAGSLPSDVPPDLYELIVPALVADTVLAECFCFEEEPLLDCPVIVVRPRGAQVDNFGTRWWLDRSASSAMYLESGTARLHSRSDPRLLDAIWGAMLSVRTP